MKSLKYYYLLLGAGLVLQVSEASAEEKTYASKENAPVIYGTKKATLHKGDSFSIKDARFRVVARDYEDGDINQIQVISNNVDTSKPGKYFVEYKVKDSDNNETSFKTEVEILDENTNNEKEHEDIIVKKMYNNPSTWNTQLQGIYRGDHQDREMVGVLLKPNEKIEAKVLQGPDIKVSVVTNDSLKDGETKVITKDKYTEITTDPSLDNNDNKSDADVSAVPFAYTPLNSKEEGNVKKEIEVEYKIKNNIDSVMYYRYGDDESAFRKEWENRENEKDYAVIDGDAVTVLVPHMDKDKLTNHWNKHFDTLDDFLDYFDSVRNEYDGMLGNEKYADSLLNQQTETKYFVRANAHGAGAAYYGTDHVGVNRPSVASFFEPNWGGLHELGHGYQGSLRGNDDFPLGEVSNNIYGYFVQHDSNIYKYTDYYLKLDEKEKEFNTVRQDSDETKSFTEYDVNQQLYILVNLLNSFDKPKEVYASLNKWYRNYIKDGATIDAQDAWVRMFAEKYQINIIPYFDAWGIKISKETREYVTHLDDIRSGGILGDLSLDSDKVEKISPLTYSFVTNRELEKTNASGQLKLSFNTEDIEKMDGRKVLIKDGSRIVKRISIDKEETEISLPVGYYQILLPSLDGDTTFEVPYFSVKQNETTKVAPTYKNRKEQQDLPEDTFKILGAHYDTDALVVKLNSKTQKADITLGGANMGNLSPTDDQKGKVASSVTFVSGKTQEIKKKYEVLFGKDQYYCYLKDENGETLSKNQTLDINIGDKMIVHHHQPQRLRFYSGYDGKEDNKNIDTTSENMTYVLTKTGWRLESRDENEFEESVYQRYSIQIKQQLDDAMKDMPDNKIENRYSLSNQKSQLIYIYQFLNDEDKTPYSDFIKRIKEGGKPTLFRVNNQNQVDRNQPWTMTIEQGQEDSINWKELFMAIDNEDGNIDLTDDNFSIQEKTTRLSKPNMYSLEVSVKDSDDNRVVRNLDVTVLPKKDFEDEHVQTAKDTVDKYDFLTEEEQNQVDDAIDKAYVADDIQEIVTKAKEEHYQRLETAQDEAKKYIQKIDDLNQSENQEIEEKIDAAKTKLNLTTIVQKTKSAVKERVTAAYDRAKKFIIDERELTSDHDQSALDALEKIDTVAEADDIYNQAKAESDKLLSERKKQAEEKIDAMYALTEEEKVQAKAEIQSVNHSQDLAAIVEAAQKHHDSEVSIELVTEKEKVKQAIVQFDAFSQDEKDKMSVAIDKAEDKEKVIELYKQISTEKKERVNKAKAETKDKLANADLTKEEQASFEDNLAKADTIAEVKQIGELVKEWHEKNLAQVKEMATPFINELLNLSDEERTNLGNTVAQAKDYDEIEAVLIAAIKENNTLLENAYTEAEKNIQALTHLQEKAEWIAYVKKAETVNDVKKIVELAKQADEWYNSDLTNTKAQAKQIINDFKYMSANKKQTYIRQIEEANQTDMIEQIIATAVAEEQQLFQIALAKAQNEAEDKVDGMIALTSEQRQLFKAEIRQAQSVEQVNDIVTRAQKQNDDMVDYEFTVYKDTVKENIDQLDELTYIERRDFKEKVDAAKNKREVQDIFAEAQAKNTENAVNKAINIATKTIASLSGLTHTQRETFTRQVKEADSVEEVNAIVAQAKEQEKKNESYTYHSQVHYITFKSENDTLYSDKSLTHKKGNTSSYHNQTLKIKGYYENKAGHRFVTVYNKDNQWLGYIDEKNITIEKHAGGAYHSLKRYVSATRDKVKRFSNFNFDQKGTISKETTYYAKGYYYHFNGHKYYSIYDNNNKWQGYVDASVFKEAKTNGGVYHSYNRYVTIVKDNYTLWKDFDFKAKKGQTKSMEGHTYYAKGYYKHINGSTYYSIYDRDNHWLGYLNYNAAKLGKNDGRDKVGIHQSVKKTMKVKRKNYTLWSGFDFTDKKGNTTSWYNKTVYIGGQYEYYNGTIYYSVYDKKGGRWLGYVNQNAMK